MRRSNLITNDTRLHPQEYTKSLGLAYSAEIIESLRPNILPGMFTHSFPASNAPLYVSARTSPIGKHADAEFYFEGILREKLLQSPCRMTFVEGREGLGKSTFIRYFFDCYARRDNAPVDEKLANAIVLYADVRLATDERNVEVILFDHMMRQLRTAFPSISVDDDFGLWQPKASWEDPLHAEASKGKSIRTYRAQVVQPFLTNSRVFTECALWYLTRGPGLRRHGRPVVVILDNVDQLDRVLQVALLRIVLTWAYAPPFIHMADAGVSSTFLPDVWRILVAVRPETLRTVRNIIAPLPPYNAFRLGPLDEVELLRRRGEHLSKSVLTTGRQLERDVEIEDNDTTMYEVVTARLAADRLRFILDFDMVLGTSTTMDKQPATQQHARGIISMLVDGSARRMLEVHGRLLQSRYMEQELMRSKEQQSRQGNYSLVHALLVGGLACFEDTDPHNPILNVFNTCRISDGPYGLLLGVHLLHMLRTQTYTKNDIIRLLAEIGYYHAEVEECLERMAEKQLFTVSQDPDGTHRLELFPGIVEAHIELCTHPAYIDEMAMVTPIEHSRLSSMKITTPHSVSFFEDRVRTSLEFLSQIRVDQDRFCKWSEDGMRYTYDYATFASRFDALRLPDVCRRAAVQYRKRLLRLSSERPGLRKHVPANVWKKLLNDPILCVNDIDSRAVLRATRHS